MKKSSILDLNPFRKMCSGHRCHTFHFPKRGEEKERENQLTNKCRGIANRSWFNARSLTSRPTGVERPLLSLLWPEISTRQVHSEATRSVHQLHTDQQSLAFAVTFGNIGLFSQNAGSSRELLFLWKGTEWMKRQRRLCSFKCHQVHQNW